MFHLKGPIGKVRLGGGANVPYPMKRIAVRLLVKTKKKMVKELTPARSYILFSSIVCSVSSYNTKDAKTIPV